MATLTLTPDATTQLYRGQIFTLTATVDNAGGANINPSTDNVTFTLRGMSKLDPAVPFTVPLTPDATTPTTGTATLDVYVTSFASATNRPSVFADTNIVTPGPASNTYPAPRDVEVTSISGPDKTYIPSAPNDDGVPFEDNGKYTSTMSVTIVDRQSKAPVPNLYVHWTEEYGYGLFSRARPFGIDFSKPATTPPATVALEPMADPNYPPNLWQMVRTPTDVNGVATLYIVSRQTVNAFTRFYDGVDVMPSYYGRVSVGQVFSSDLTIPQFGAEPLPQGLEGGVLMLDRSPGPNVPVHVPAYPGWAVGEQIFLLLNGKLYDRFGWTNEEYNSVIPKSAIYSDTGPHAGQDNTLVFAACGGPASGTGGIRVSGTQTFKAKGAAGANAPDPDHYPGILERLSIEDTENFIFYEMTLDPVIVDIPIRQHNWAGVVGDKITLTFYLNAYVPNTNNPKAGIVPPRGTGANEATITLAAGDVGTGRDKYHFSVPGTQFADYDRQSGPPFHKGTFVAVYKVEPVGGGTLYSRIVNGTIDTTPSGKRKESAS